MLKALSVSLKLSLFTFACLFTSPTLAQVTTDGTVNTQVNQNGNVAEITGGESRGGNLFHSFQDFSVQTGNEAFFNNADNISNIFSRVTGGNRSNIDGALRANGSANLFLINPAGIIFGENARLDIGGSFYGSTASSVLFEDGEFSAVDNLQQPVLTINAPIGLSFRDNPRDIVNRSRAESSIFGDIAGLEVSPRNSLALIGGNINFEAGNATARSGNINLGGLSQAGIVEIGQDSNFSFPENVAKADVSLSNNADVNVVGIGEGDIAINAQNLSLEAGELGRSLIDAGIFPDPNFTDAETQAGDITIDVAENITLNNSDISNQVSPEGVGNSGNITISTGSLEANNGGQVDASTFGQGNAGTVNITATGDITADGENSQGFQSGITSGVNTGATGDAGGVTISTANLNLTNGGRVDASTLGQGNAGAVNVTATGDITADGEDSQGFRSGITSGVEIGAIGDAGGVTISTANLNLTNGGRVGASTFGTGNAGAVNVTVTGDITADGEDSSVVTGIESVVGSDAEGDSGGATISTNNLTLTNGGRVNASTSGTGNAGAVSITATGDITADGEENSEGSPSGITSRVNRNAEGNSGGVTISTTNLTLTNSGRVSAGTFGTGNAGAINITATGDITANGEDSNRPTGIESVVGSDAEGDSGGVTISTTNLTIDGSRVDASTFGQGNAGAINITATGNITADGEDSNDFATGIISLVDADAEGDSGGITISTNDLNLTNGGIVSADTFGQGNAGAINITATDDITANGQNSQGSIGSAITSQVGENVTGNSGGISILTTNLNLTNGGAVDASTFGEGNAGDVSVNASESIFISGIEDFRVGISANAVVGNGNGGNVNISTNRLTIQNNGIVEASNRDFQNVFSSGTGLPGNISIEANTIELNNGAIGAATQSTEGVKGNINLQVAENIILQDNSFISAEAFGEADGGNLSIDTNFIIAFPGDNDIVASAEQGQGGNININTESLFGIAERPLNDSTNDINASSEFSLDGTVNVSTPDVNPAQGVTELPNNIVVPEETTQQACEANRESAAKNGLNITGKGGIVPEPGLPLDSLNVTVNGESTSAEAIPQPIETSKGKIQLARGIKVTESGEIILTPHRSHNEQQRILEASRNCG